jgi:hypothetical protein
MIRILRFLSLLTLTSLFGGVVAAQANANSSAAAPSQNSLKATAGAGVAIGQGIAFSGFISPRADFLYAQTHVFIDFDGDYVVNVDGVYPLTKLLGVNRFWDIYAGLGFVAGDSQNFGWEWSDDRGTDGDLYFGARVPVGAMFYIPSTPFQVGAEVAPSFLISPVKISYLAGALIGRVVFEF